MPCPSLAASRDVWGFVTPPLPGVDTPRAKGRQLGEGSVGKRVSVSTRREPYSATSFLQRSSKPHNYRVDSFFFFD